MGKSVIPIGMSLGAYYGDDGELGSMELLVGEDLHELSFDEWLIWGLSRSDEHAHYEHSFDRAAFQRAIDQHENTISSHDQNHIIEKLINIGALIEADLKSEPLEPVLSKFKLIPTASSAGNTPEKPDLYGIGRGDEPELFFSAWCQTLWSGSHHYGSIWNACKLLAEQVEDTTAAEVAEEFANVLPIIVATDCGYLEPMK